MNHMSYAALPLAALVLCDECNGIGTFNVDLLYYDVDFDCPCCDGTGQVIVE